MNRKRFFSRIILALLMSSLCGVSAWAVDETGGIGLKLGQLYDNLASDHRGSFVVLDIYESSPAQAAGVQRGDVITHIDGQPTKGRDFMKVVQTELRGEAGTEVKLKVWRFQTKKRLDITVQRVPMVY